SFILQCILEEFWNDSDIDIYTPIEENTDVGKGDHYKGHKHPGFTTLEYFLYKKLQHHSHASQGTTYDPTFRMDKISIERVLEYGEKSKKTKGIMSKKIDNETKLQVIEIWTKNDINEIKAFVNSFDFD